MNTTTPLLALVLALCSTAVSAQATQLTPEPARISDAAIQADYATYNALQERIHQLNERGLPVRDYHLSKAQCWLDVSLHEYTRNDRSAFPQDALTESEKLILALEKRTTPLPMDTPLVNGAARLRPDLWARTEALKRESGFQCAWPKVACAEVELVHAGNEQNQQQWRHAKPYVQIAEGLVSEANGLVAQCYKAPEAPKVVASQVPLLAPVPLLPFSEPVTLSANVLFDFDQHTPDHIRSASRAELDNLLTRVKLEGITITSLALVGHADRLNGTGHTDYNQQLSQMRVNAVRDVLVEQGLTVSGVSIEAKGDRDQMVACHAQFKKPAELQECLLPNRRVEIQIRGVKSVQRSH
jgi:outer membrane protein OmpA-like peptidoglycan-associated protein